MKFWANYLILLSHSIYINSGHLSKYLKQNFNNNNTCYYHHYFNVYSTLGSKKHKTRIIYAYMEIKLPLISTCTICNPFKL